MPNITPHEPRNISEALVVTPARVTEVDWEDLGGIFAEQNSKDQAAFLIGMAWGLDGTAGLMQMEYVASEIATQAIEKRLVHDMLTSLIERIQP